LEGDFMTDSYDAVIDAKRKAVDQYLQALAERVKSGQTEAEQAQRNTTVNESGVEKALRFRILDDISAGAYR
jgi:hypothetical protein